MVVLQCGHCRRIISWFSMFIVQPVYMYNLLTHYFIFMSVGRRVLHNLNIFAVYKTNLYAKFDC